MEAAGDADALGGREPLRLLGRRFAPRFVVRIVILGRGRQRAFDERDWWDALVVLERGQVEIQCEGEIRRRFASGSVLCLDRLPGRVIHQRGADPALIVSVRRRTCVEAASFPASRRTLGGMADGSDRNRRVIEEFRANGGNVPGWERQPLLLLHHRGAKSGTWRVNPLAQQELPNGWAIFASKGGAPTDPDWYHNLVINPDAKVEVGPSSFDVRAHVATGAERERIWEEQKRRNRWFAEYERRTSREIPVIVLERVGDGSGSQTT